MDQAEPTAVGGEHSESIGEADSSRWWTKGANAPLGVAQGIGLLMAAPYIFTQSLTVVVLLFTPTTIQLKSGRSYHGVAIGVCFL